MQETIKNAMPDFLSGGGEMGKLMRAKDWSKTPLGSPDTWPQSLRTAISICIASNFPICISWGPHRVQIYNDGYWPITGDMHPASMGQDFKECWISAWPVIGQAFEEASLGATRFLENQRIFLDRYGYTEETFFTFSFSPILDESGGVGGLFHPVIEQTQQTLSERRLNILPAVAQHTLTAKTTKEASASILDCLKDFELDIPFALLYSITDNGKEAMIEGSVGLESNSPLAPARINLEEHALKSWHLAEAVQTGKGVLVENLTSIFGTFHSGPYPEPPTQALIFPVTLPGIESNNYFFVAGISARRRLDAKCLLFYELLTASITSVLTKSKTYEQAREKAEALAEIDRAKTVFFSNISHEFRTPLTLMLSPLEELLNRKNNNFSESENQNIQTTHRNAMRLLKLVNTLLDFSRIESGRQQAMFSLVDIASLTKNLAANFRSVIEKAGLELIVKADTIMQPVYVDRQMWEKVVFNLVSNAFKYTLEGSIIVELSAEKDFAVLQVKDTGIGIPENELPKIFERFHRVQNAAGRTYEGTGIGLSLIKELVLMHKGNISVESELNEGSVFTVKIPFGKEHLNGQSVLTTEMDADEVTATIYIDEIETLLETGTKQKAVSPIEKSTLPTVLVVDDNADMRQHIRSVLSKDFNVVTANNGMDALDKLKETVPALVLSDVMMPVMDGIGLLKEIKSNKATATIPVILLTARAGEESKIEGWETGADDYLVKPFSAKELLARVQAQIKIVQLRQSLEGKVRNLFMEAPAIICVLRGPQHVFELANEVYLQLIGKRDVLGKTVLEVMPELEGQGYLELLDNVYATGEPYTGNETPAQIDRGAGKLEEAYFNHVYQPTHNSEGEIDGVLLHGIEVTEQVLSRKKIEESEKRFSNLLMESPFAFAILKGKDMVVSLANDAIKRIWGKGSDIENKPLLSIMPEIEEQGFAALLENVYTAGKPFYGHEELVRLQRNGIWEDVYFNFIYQPYKEADETISGVTIIANEVTTQAMANKKIAISEQNVSRLFMEAPAAICVLRGPQHVHELTNEKYLHVVGKKNIVGKSIREAFPELKGQGIYELLDNVYTTGVPFFGTELPTKLDKGNGNLEEVYFNFVYQPVHNSEGKVDGIFVHGVEVTEQVLSRKKIEESERQLKLYKDQLDLSISAGRIGIWSFSVSDNYLYWSKEQCDLYGIAEHEFGNTPNDFTKFVHKDDLIRLNQIMEASYKAQQTDLSYQFRILRTDGMERWIESRTKTQFNAAGKPEFITGINVDITDEKLFSRELEKKVDERTIQLNGANRNLEEKNIELQQMNKELEAFTYISSHDLQEPLRKIQTFAGRIIATEKEQLSDTAKDYFRRMNDAATRMQTLIQDLLVFSRVNTSERKFEITDLAKIIDEVKEDFREAMEEKNATITTGEMCEAHIIPFQVRQLMHNLIGNALKFSRKDIRPAIIVKSEKMSAADSPLNKPTCHISVSDNGIGFEKEYSEKIFEVFQRLHSKEAYAGTGIGLAIVKKIVDNHHGIITAESKLGEGATFNIYIPV